MNETKARQNLAPYLKIIFGESRNVLVEVKLCKGTSFPFRNIEDSQYAYLLSGKHHSFTYHPPDIGVGYKVVDLIFIANALAYFAIAFHHERTPLIYYFFDIDRWLNIEKTCGRKSLTEDMACEMSDHTFILPPKKR